MTDVSGKTMVSIIVCTYNRSEMLSDTLNSLIHQKNDNQYSYDIIVVDDKSTDNTKQVVLEYSYASSIPVYYRTGPGNGIAAARNAGLTEVKSEWIAYFDDDQIAEPTWLKSMLDCAFSRQASCVGGKRVIRLLDTKKKLSKTDRLVLGEIDLGAEVRKCKRKEYPAAGNMMLHNDVFNKAGQFDESLIRGGEDIEFAARLRKSGIDAFYTPHALVHHITPDYRTEPEYLFWASLRSGENFAHRDYLEWGIAKTCASCVARIGLSLLCHFPVLIRAYISGDRTQQGDVKNRLLRTYTYACRTLNFISPRLFSMEILLGKLEFRKERSIFQIDDDIKNETI